MIHRCSTAVFLLTFHLVAAQEVKYALLDQSVSLNPTIKTSPGMQMLWKHNGDKVVEFNGNEERVYSLYEGRVTLDWHTAELEITGLRYEDSGDYELEVFKDKLDHSHHQLAVIDKVSKPTISCKKKGGANSDGSGNQATLVCSAESGQSESLMKFEWTSHGKTHPGPNLTISLGDDDDEEYNCTVSNPLSGETTVFTARDCNSETNGASIIVGSVVGVVAILGLLAGLFLLIRKRRQKKEPGENRGNPEEEALVDRPSPQSPASSPPENEDVMSKEEIPRGHVKKMRERFDRKTEPKKETDKDNKTNPAPAHPNDVCSPPSVRPVNSSNTLPEGGHVEHNEDTNLEQGSVEPPETPAGEPGLEEGKESDSEINHTVSPVHEDTKKEITTPTEHQTSSVSGSEGADVQGNIFHQPDFVKESTQENWSPHPQSQSVAGPADPDQSGKNMALSGSQSESGSKKESGENERPADQQEEQINGEPEPGGAEPKAEDSEKRLSTDGDELCGMMTGLTSGNRLSTGDERKPKEQSPKRGEKELYTADIKQQQEDSSHDDDQQENSQHPESSMNLRNDPKIFPDSTTVVAPNEGNKVNSSHSSPSESSSEEAG